MKFSEQVFLNYIISPKSKKILKFSDDKKCLLDIENKESFFFNSFGAPVLLNNSKYIDEYLEKSQNMLDEYQNISKRTIKLWDKIKNSLSYDFRTKKSKTAFIESIKFFNDKNLGLNIGGGPSRVNKWLTNVNIAPYKNIDVVADVHNLPYIDNCVEYIYCEAVIEHLHSPNLAVKEMFRVLKKGGKAYIVTPFMQTYHGYPDHYQNLTLSGHKKLFEKAGFKVVDYGTCVGPLYALMNTVTAFIKNYTPYPINKILRILWAFVEIVLRPLDIYFGNLDKSYVLASSTYVSIEK